MIWVLSKEGEKSEQKVGGGGGGGGGGGKLLEDLGSLR